MWIVAHMLRVVVYVIWSGDHRVWFGCSFERSCEHRDLPSFQTRRYSDRFAQLQRYPWTNWTNLILESTCTIAQLRKCIWMFSSLFE